MQTNTMTSRTSPLTFSSNRYLSHPPMTNQHRFLFDLRTRQSAATGGGGFRRRLG
ncbi:hypothetical protein Hanom_Chr14g01298891 [Helianthus anomalus]